MANNISTMPDRPSRRWSVNEFEYESLAAALEALPRHVVAGDVPALFAQALPDDPEHNLRVTTDGRGRPWIEVPTTLVEIQLAPGAPAWLEPS
jgi:hypothetical protein